MRALWLVCVLVGAAGSFGADGEQGIGDLINTKCRRSVDVSSQFARTTIGLAFRNQGKTPLEEYFLAFPMQQAARLSYITAGDHEGNSFKVTRAPTIKGGK